VGRKVKRCQQTQRGEKNRDSKIRMVRYSRSSMAQANEALGRTHCNLSPKQNHAWSYFVIRLGDVTGVTTTAPGSSFLCHDEASVVEFLDRPGRREGGGRPFSSFGVKGFALRFTWWGRRYARCQLHRHWRFGRMYPLGFVQSSI